MREGPRIIWGAPAWEKLSAVLERTSKRPSVLVGVRPKRCPGPNRPVITQDPVMLNILRMAKSVAPTRATVLIQGNPNRQGSLAATSTTQRPGRRLLCRG